MRNNYEVEIISPSWTNCITGFYKGDRKHISKYVSLKTFCTFGAKYRVQRIFKYMFSLIQLFIYLLIHVRRDESVIVYHSVLLFFPVKLAKRLKGFNLILEVEEIYQNVVELSEVFKRSEYAFFDSADKYIFSTELLHERINSREKPYAVVHGTYQVERMRETKFDDNRVHVVYAGTLDSRKGGAFVAAASAEFLDENYHVHIIGFGTREQTNHLESIVDRINKESEAIVSYDGLLMGEDYVRFLQKCHIGLSTQNPDGEYNNTSFPSKILSYLANGLRVVTIRIEAIERSVIGDKVYYYEEQDPREIASVISRIDLNQTYDSRQVINGLDAEFSDRLMKLLDSDTELR